MILSQEEFSRLLSILFAISGLAPGFIIVYIRNQFVTGRSKSVAQYSAEYGVVTAIYFAATLSLFFEKLSTNIGFFLIFFCLPCVIGIVLGVIAQTGVMRHFWSIFGLTMVHPAPTAWDYLFAFKKKPFWIIATMKDGSIVNGYYDRSTSFASSDLSNRDLYIADVTDANFDSVSENGELRGIWINEDDIRCIEFLEKKE